MGELIRIGMDTSKHFFDLHGVDAAERVVLRRRLRRAQVEGFFAALPPVLVAIEACGASHHWARTLQALGHEVRILPAQLVKPYVTRGKHDAADAAALCEAVSRPGMRRVPVKTEQAQARLMLVQHRARLVQQRTALANAIRAHAAEFGRVVPLGLERIPALLAMLREDSALPAIARTVFADMGEGFAELDARLRRVERDLATLHREDAVARRLVAIPGLGPIGAVLLALKVEAHAFGSGRDLAAWLGLTPRNHSSGGKQKLGAITRAGDAPLRAVLVSGATAYLRQVRLGRARCPNPWLVALLQRKSPKEAAVAWANKMARIAWKLMVSGESYRHAATPSTPRAKAA